VGHYIRGRGATGSSGQFIDPPLFKVRGPHMALDPSLFVVFTCVQSVLAVVIHSSSKSLKLLPTDDGF